MFNDLLKDISGEKERIQVQFDHKKPRILGMKIKKYTSTEFFFDIWWENFSFSFNYFIVNFFKVCAQSNCAVDELFSRVMNNQFVDFNLNSYVPDILRVGKAPMVWKFLLISIFDFFSIYLCFSDRYKIQVFFHSFSHFYDINLSFRTSNDLWIALINFTSISISNFDFWYFFFIIRFNIKFILTLLSW